MAMPLSPEGMERSLGADLMEELTKPPCLLGAVGKNLRSYKLSKDDFNLLDLASSPTTSELAAPWEETPTCSSLSNSPRRWRDLSPMKVPLPEFRQKELLSDWMPMRVERNSDATREQCLPALAAWAAQEARAGRFTCLSTSPDQIKRPEVRPGFPSPAWPCPFEAPPALPPPALPPQPSSAEENRRRGKCGSYAAKFVFSGFDPQIHSDFELVPRLIGRKGCNLRPISQGCRGKIRVTGWDGSQPMGKFASGKPLASDAVEVTLTCHDSESLDEGIRELRVLLEDLS
ncbi:unnamed protein product, partial [Effrenium voratum]